MDRCYRCPASLLLIADQPIITDGEALEQALGDLLVGRRPRLATGQQVAHPPFDVAHQLAAGLALHPVQRERVAPAAVLPARRL